MWCNGNTDDFDSSIAGSSPAIPATKNTTDKALAYDCLIR